MDRDEIGRIAHSRHPVAAPVSSLRLQQVIAGLAPPEDGRIVDLGCGSGAWLLQALETHPQLSGVGVDISPSALAEARSEAAGRRLADRVRWIEADGSRWSDDGGFDVVICVGASHAFGGLDDTLRAVRSHLRPGGEVVLGDMIWDREPTQAALEALQVGRDELPDLAGLVERVRESGFEVVDGHVSTLEEWDDYEWSWTGSLVRWALDRPTGSEERAEVLAVAREHRDAWLKGYRRRLGFATLVLRQAS
ncbi:MAG TPA: class I SAM-dependent methyltransferase [Gaiellaceae bacterium]|nr:class I SAM-dependent methyltransferase [Gaiellaceae bacterium]